MILFFPQNVKKSLILKKKIVLASTSRYRAELLGRLQFAFEAVKPDADESALPGEKPAETARRLAESKAQSVAGRYPDALIVGSDQVADLRGRAIGKPGTIEAAFRQLQELRGELVVFHTAVSLIDTAAGNVDTRVIATSVAFRHYSDAEIRHYLDHENALDCAGSAKAEGLGVALMESMQSDDPTALIGLPLIALVDMLRRAGYQVLA